MSVQRESHVVTFPRLLVNYLMNSVSAPITPPFNHPPSIASHHTPPSNVPILLSHSLQVHLQTCSNTASKCIPNFAPSHSLDVHLEVYIIIWPPRASPNTLDHGLQVRATMASNCISKLARSQPPSSNDHDLQVHRHTRLLMASKFTQSWAPTLSPHLLHYSLQVDVYVQEVISSKCISEYTWWSSSGTPPIALKHCLQLVQIYCV